MTSIAEGRHEEEQGEKQEEKKLQSQRNSTQQKDKGVHEGEGKGKEQLEIAYGMYTFPIVCCDFTYYFFHELDEEIMKNTQRWGYNGLKVLTLRGVLKKTN